jgi:crotonobetaine/carnitine-CoA ligase
MADERPSLARRWGEAVAARGEQPFLTFETREGMVRDWTYAQFDELVERVASGLAHHGVGPGERVHLVLANSPAFVAVWLACVRIGAAIVPSDPRSTARELALYAERVHPRVAVIGAECLDAYRADAATVIAVDEDDGELEPLLGATGVGSVQPGALDTAAILFTSGTTSAPKGVIVTQANYAFAGDVMAAAATVRPDDRLLVVLPLFHANAQYYSFAAAITAGASVALMPVFSASRFVQQAARHHATHASLFAAPMRMILARGATPVPGVRLRHVWYAQNLTESQYEDFAALVGCRPRQLYGMTETLAAVLSQRALDPEPGFLGDTTNGCDVELDEVGEITVGGRRGYELFAGYLDDRRSTEAAFRDGRFRTGDLARRDGLGRLSFAGRRSDVLKVAGENVSTVEVEAVLAQHPAVHEVAVVGEPDPVRDEVPVAYVVGAPGRAVDAEALAAWAADRLAPAKRPRAVHVVDALPRTSVGKIRKFLLGGPAHQPAEASNSPAGGGPGS